ncbi:MAG TPA: hypothetical protein VNK46_14655 [Nitrospiraceae bacterium]|jgi:hypothetical protein|nr:hypothetical protein [Nitrospiraceae bacterium]
MVSGNADIDRQDVNRQNAVTGLLKAELFKAVMAACAERLSQDIGVNASDVSQALKELAVQYETARPVAHELDPCVMFLHRWTEA